MKFITLLSLTMVSTLLPLMMISFAFALPNSNIPPTSNHPYIHNGPDGNGKRAPCPALNALANHGFISRDGQGITRQQLISSLKEVYHISNSFAKTLSDKAFSICGENRNETYDGTLTLSCLGKSSKIDSKFIEHDVSLSRLDCPNHDCTKPNAERVADFMSFVNEKGQLGISEISNYRKHLECDISSKDPDFSFPFSSRIVAAGEAALVTSVLGQGSPVPVIYIRPFFLEERLPIEEGWVRPESEVGPKSLSFDWTLARYTFAETTRKC